VEITDVTQIVSPRRRLRRWLAGASAPPSLQAQLVLMISALLLGGVLTSLLFVGIWRHTAADGQRASAAQLASKHQLRATQRKLTSIETAQASERTALAKARLGQAATAAELARLRQLHHALANSLQPQLQALASTTGTLTHDTSALKSEIAALRAYLRSASPAGADSGFLDAQIKYLVASTESANAAASTLEQETQHAQVAAAKLGKTTH
jgi:septal ring factor EnvC (AmiA/AmiB activator)